MGNKGGNKVYKLTNLDGADFYSGTINYADNIGKIIRIKDYDPPPAVCGRGLHASKNPNDCFVGARIPCRAFRVKGIQRISGDSIKCRYQALKVLDEIRDLDALFGWKYSEAINPIDPFSIPKVPITEKQIILLKKWHSVRDSVWDSVRDSVGHSVWDSVWAYIGSLFPKPNVYLFQPAVDLWKQGLVPSYDGKIWRLHGGIRGEILYEDINA